MFKKRPIRFSKVLKNRTGFTIVELMVTLSILGILMAIAVPSYFSWLPRHRLQASARQIYDDMNLAKIQAVKGNTNAYITFSTLNSTYFIFLDDLNPNGVYNAGETILRNNVPLEKDVTIAGTTFTADTVGFNNRGLLPTGYSSGRVNLTNPTALIMRIDVNAAGGISIL